MKKIYAHPAVMPLIAQNQSDAGVLSMMCFLKNWKNWRRNMMDAFVPRVWRNLRIRFLALFYPFLIGSLNVVHT
ncbi:MAG: hypothetical protein U5Q03_16045 [Bacteroidota bacterium]|nr:hypothetical protein [Bacteroidota bacterium]